MSSLSVRPKSPTTRSHQSKGRDLRVITQETARKQMAQSPPQANDTLILGAVFLLIGIGIVLVYSSSSAFAARLHDDAQHFLKHQAAWLAIGLLSGAVATRVTGAWLRRRAAWGLVVACILCALVLIPGIGHLAGGARR